jgi:hypothetical protein
MVLLFLLDVISSAAIRITVNVGTWIACKSMNGLYYAYKAVKYDSASVTAPAPAMITTTVAHFPATGTDELKSETEYVVLTREEYNRLTELTSG